MTRRLLKGKPDHQQFAVGDFTLYSHDYDGEVLQLVKQNGAAPAEQVAVRAVDLHAALDQLIANKRVVA